MNIYKRHDPSPKSSDIPGISGQQVGEICQPLMEGAVARSHWCPSVTCMTGLTAGWLSPFRQGFPFKWPKRYSLGIASTLSLPNWFIRHAINPLKINPLIDKGSNWLMCVASKRERPKGRGCPGIEGPLSKFKCPGEFRGSHSDIRLSQENRVPKNSKWEGDSDLVFLIRTGK